MYKRQTLLLLGISLVLLAGLFVLTRLVDKNVDNRFSDSSRVEATPQEQPAPQVENPVQKEDPLASSQDESLLTDISKPTFTIYNAQNQPYALDDFADRPVVLYFWASHSKSSTAGLAVMERYFQKHGRNVYFLVVNVVDGEKETRKTSDAYLASKDYSFPVYYDLDGLCNEYYNKKVPLAIFFGRDGSAVTYFNEQPTTDLMQRCFQKILN